MYFRFFKPLIDIVISSAVLLVFVPIMIIVALLIKLDSNGPVFFKQNRLGKDGTIFKLYKFRTMVNKQNAAKDIFKGDPDVTGVGYWLRRFKIDEVPQLFNVLFGQMSIIGPRPCLPAIQDKFDTNTPYRFNVKPGLTSLAAIKGGIYLTWKEKWIYDRIYVESLSFKNDIIIVMKTVLVVLLGEKRFLEHPNRYV